MGVGTVGDEGIHCGVRPPVWGILCTVVWTDHKNNTKISLMPPDACGEKVIRWWQEILRAGHHPRFTAGKVNPSDGFSRNPADRDQVLAKRTACSSYTSDAAGDPTCLLCGDNCYIS